MNLRRYLRLVVPGMVAAGVSPSMSAAEPFTAADLTVRDTVVARDVEPIGANLTALAGGTNFAVNNLVKGSGMEPIVWRKLVRIDAVGENWFNWESHGGASGWNLIYTGFGNGARVRFFRLVDSNDQPLPYLGGFGEVEDADHVQFVGEATVPMPSTQFPEGGWISPCKDPPACQDWDFGPEYQKVYIDKSNLGLRRGDYAFILLKANFIGPETSPPNLRQHYSGDHGNFSPMDGTYTARFVPHPGTLPAEFTEPGETCMEITAPNAERVALGQATYHPLDDGEGQWYSQLRPGAPYRAEIWMRQEGLGDGGRVKFLMTECYSSVNQTDPWVVTDQWKRFTFDFTAPPYPTTGGHGFHGLQFTGPGKLWIDNFVLYRNDATHGFKPYGPHEVTLDEFKASVSATSKKPVVRIYPFSYSHAWVTSLFGNHANSGYNVSWAAGVGEGPNATIAQGLEWALATGTTPSTRAVPHITFTEKFWEEEWAALVEYLGVPYNPSVDTPQSKPHAYARYQFRNQIGTPWTDEFREIVIEFGNETWHNGAGGYGWDGFGSPGAVWQGGKEYGLFARYMFDENVMRMPAWNANNLGAKIKLALGAGYSANRDDYAELASQQGATVSYLGHANYVGPKWETGDTGSTSFNDHGVQETLIGLHTGMRQLIQTAATTRTELGDHYRLLAYEGGPSGYWQNENNPQVDELYGKSVAMGLAALDAWMFSSLNGYVHQAYLGFGSGKWWSSHTLPEAGGFRAHAGWLALRMRNSGCTAPNMHQVDFTSVPTYDRNGQDVPLLSAYALGGNDTWCLLLLSRKLGGNHDGVDFGDGTTPVTVHLPFDAPHSITLHRLARPDGSFSDPRDNNIDALNVAIHTQSVDASAFSRDFVVNASTGGAAGGLPQGSVFLYVFNMSGQVECTPPTEPCDGVCVDTSISPLHCGSCNHACDPGQVCRAAQCETPTSSSGPSATSGAASSGVRPSSSSAVSTATSGAVSTATSGAVSTATSGAVSTATSGAVSTVTSGATSGIASSGNVSGQRSSSGGMFSSSGQASDEDGDEQGDGTCSCDQSQSTLPSASLLALMVAVLVNRRRR